MSDIGKEIQRHQRSFEVDAQADGGFVIDDVPPGTYELSGELHEAVAGRPWFFGKVLGRAKQEVMVPDRAAGNPNQDMELGDVVVQMIPRFKPGDAAPDFEVKTIDGGSLRLADFRGKFVLLDFWATWCGPCRRETPNLKAVYDAFGGDPEFAMIGLSLDKSPDAPRDYAKKESILWRQGILGDWSNAILPTRYGVEGIPAIFLIDPAGRILESDLRGDAIKAAVSKAIGNR
jgi:peroxiredoxin